MNITERLNLRFGESIGVPSTGDSLDTGLIGVIHFTAVLSSMICAVFDLRVL